MSLPDAASLEACSLAELREVVGRLVGEVQQLHSGNVALQARVDTQQVTITALRAENQALRDEVARLKGLPPRPPSRPSGMEQATQPGVADTGATRPKLPRGVKPDAQAITAERVLKVAVPVGSRFKGYEDILVRDLRLSAEPTPTAATWPNAKLDVYYYGLGDRWGLRSHPIETRTAGFAQSGAAGQLLFGALERV